MPLSSNIYEILFYSIFFMISCPHIYLWIEFLTSFEQYSQAAERWRAQDQSTLEDSVHQPPTN